MPSVYFPTPRGNGSLPTSVYQEKMERKGGSHVNGWFTPVYIPFPGSRSRHIRIFLPTLPRKFHILGHGRRRGLLLTFLGAMFIFALISLTRRTDEKPWSPPPFLSDPPTLIFKREDLQRVWKWEISSGHYPSRRSLPLQLGLKSSPANPALPPRKTSLPSRFRPPPGVAVSTSTTGIGPKRIYLDIQSQQAYPPRPVPGSIADLDIVMQHCDFSEHKFVRDCLEVLRTGAGLDNGKHFRRGKMDDWRYIYVEQASNDTTRQPTPRGIEPYEPQALEDKDPDSAFVKRRNTEWEVPPISLPSPMPYQPYAQLEHPCDPDYPRIYHMFWTGPFTDKPYLALASFVYTQNLGLHLKEYPADSACRPQFWLWINPGPAASGSNPSAVANMFDELKANPWAAPFLHPRFKDAIFFKLWNTTEQLDGVHEIKDHWRTLATLFNSGGHMVNVKSKKTPESLATTNGTQTGTQATQRAPTGKVGDEDEMEDRLGSKSASSYDRLSVILSDMARFVLCHRFGGIYLDADTVLLRDWEELWGSKQAFAYRWSRLDRYNTAVLHMNKGSALGSFLFKTALKNELDFHPMTISRYLKDAQMEGLLLRLPDALFDSAWLNTEYYQRDRPPQPFFSEFGDFFDTPVQTSAAPQALGLNGFFRGAYSYHFHNYWWKPCDRSRNYPDLGPRFISSGPATPGETRPEEGTADEDRRDLDWSTVIKRTFEAHIRGEVPNSYGEFIAW